MLASKGAQAIITLADLIFGTTAASIGTAAAAEGLKAGELPPGVTFLEPSAGGPVLLPPSVTKRRDDMMKIVKDAIKKMIGSTNSSFIQYRYGKKQTSNIGALKEKLQNNPEFISDIVKAIGDVPADSIKTSKDVIDVLTKNNKQKEIIDSINKTGIEGLPKFSTAFLPPIEKPVIIPGKPNIKTIDDVKPETKEPEIKTKTKTDPLPPPLPPIDPNPKPPPTEDEDKPRRPPRPIPPLPQSESQPKKIKETKIQDPKIKPAVRQQHWYPRYQLGGQDILRLTDVEKLEELKNYNLFDLVNPLLSGDSDNLLALQNKICEKRRFYNTYQSPSLPDPLPPINSNQVKDWGYQFRDTYPVPYPMSLDTPNAFNYYDRWNNEQPKSLNKQLDVLQRGGTFDPDLTKIANSRRSDYSSMDKHTMKGEANFSLIDDINSNDIDNVDLMLLR